MVSNFCFLSIFKYRWCVIGSWKNVCGVLESPGKVLDFFLTKRVGTLLSNISESTVPINSKFSELVDIWVGWGWLKWQPFYDRPRDVAMIIILFWETFHWRWNWPLSLFALAFDSGLTSRWAIFLKITWWCDSASSCKNLVNFGPVTLEITRVECAVFAVTRPQFADPTSFDTLMLRNWLKYRNSDFRWLIGDNFSTSCVNLVRLSSVIPVYSKCRSFSVVSLATFTSGRHC